MFRKLNRPAVAGLALVSIFWAGSATAQVTGTVVLKSGERHTGADIDYRYDRRMVSVRTGQNAQPRVDVGQVAYVDFGGAPDAQLNLTGSQEAVVLKDGTVVRGQIIELGHETPSDRSSAFLVIIRDSNGQEQRLNSSRVGRVYFAGGTSSTDTAPTAGTNPTATSATGLVVSAKQQWTPTGLVVRRGETLTFDTTGEITLTGGNDDMASAAGAKSGRVTATAPVPRSTAGALIGRVGNGQPFLIGNQTTVAMPAAGQLFLGVNDDHFEDNSGEFRVEISRAGRTRR